MRRASHIELTFLLVHTKNDHDFVSPDSDELLDTSDTSSRQLGEENHAINVVIFQQFDIGTHLCDLSIIHQLGSGKPANRPQYLLHIDHNIAIHLGILLFVEATVRQRHFGGVAPELGEALKLRKGSTGKKIVPFF